MICHFYQIIINNITQHSRCISVQIGYSNTIINFKTMNVNDSKYVALRKKLDQFGYTQTLHPDSVDLAARLFKDQLQALSQIEKQKKKNKSDTSNSTNNAMLSTLYDQIDRLTLEKQALEKQVEQLRGGSLSREPDERTLKLQSCVNDLRVKLEQTITNFSAQKQELQNEIEQYRIEKDRLVNDNQRLKSISSNSLTKLQDENHELAALIDRKNKEIKVLEENNSKFRIKVQVLEKSLEEAKNNSKDSRDESKTQSSRMMVILKQELSESESRFRQAKTQLEQTHEQLQGMRRQLRRAKDEIASMRSDETKNRNLDNISKAGLQKFESRLGQAHRQISNCHQQIKQLKGQVADDQAMKEKMNNKIKELNNKIKFLTDQNSDLQSEIQLISGKLTTNVKRVRELQTVSSSYEKQLKEALESGKSVSLQKLQSQIEEQKSKNQQLRKDLMLNQRQYKLLEDQLKIVREQAEQRTIERDKSLAQNKKLLTIISEGSKNLQVAQFQKEQLMKENRQLKTGKQQIISSDYAAKSQIFLLREKSQSYEVQMQELRGAIHNLQSTNAQLESQITRLQSMLSQSEEKNREVFEDNRMMVGQLKILEQRKNELHEKVRDLQEREQMKNDNTTVAKKEFDKLVVEFQHLQSELAKKDQAIKIIDSERDELQNILDQQTEEKARLQQELQAIKRQARKYGKEIDQRQYNLNDLKVKISRLESQRDDLDKQLHRQCEESIQLKDQLAIVEVSNRQLQNQVNNLVISNKENEREVERSRIRVAELDRKLKERVKDYEQQRQRATAFNILNNQLHADIQQERSEIVRLQGLMRELEEANNSMYHHLQNKDQEIEHYTRLIQDMQRQEGQYRLEIQSYQRQLENLSQDYQFTKGQLRQLSGDRQALRAERNWKKEISSQSQDWRAKQEQRYMQLQHDYDRKNHEVEQLRQKIRQSQLFLSEERSKNFRMSRQLQSIQVTSPKTMLVQSRVESYHSENENISNMHSRLRNQSLQNIRDDVSQRSQSDSMHSAMQKIRRLEEMYIQTTKPNMRS